MATLPTLVPNSLVTAGSWRTHAGQIVNLHLTIDEGIAGATDTDYIKTSPGFFTDCAFGLTDMPSDFASMDTLSYRFRHGNLDRVDDSVGYQCRIMSGATVLAAADSGGTFQTVIVALTGSSGTFLNTFATAFPYVNTTADKTAWDAAEIQLHNTYSQSMSNDNASVTISALEITGTYTAASSDKFASKRFIPMRSQTIMRAVR